MNLQTGLNTYRKQLEGIRNGGNGTKKDQLLMNAIFYDIVKKEIVDLVGGVDDIKNNIISTVGIPSERFGEDRLRILRCLRFAARTGGEIDPTTSQAIKDDNRLRGISPKEDVSQESFWAYSNASFCARVSFSVF